MFASPPNLTDFGTFVTNVMGITPAQLPTDSPYLGYAFSIAMAFASVDLGNVCVDATQDIYPLAVYNLAGDRLLNFAQDVPNAPPIPGTDPPLSFFAAARKAYGLNSFVAGVIESSTDESDSVGIAVPDSLRQLQISDLSSLKTPYGRTYLGMAQSLGTLWGLT